MKPKLDQEISDFTIIISDKIVLYFYQKFIAREIYIIKFPCSINLNININVEIEDLKSLRYISANINELVLFYDPS